MAKLDDPAALDKHMATKSYVAGFTLSKADVELYRKIAPPPPKFANAARWYAHIASLPEWRQTELAGRRAAGAAARRRPPPPAGGESALCGRRQGRRQAGEGGGVGGGAAGAESAVRTRCAPR